jgi:hypothetical protein
MSVGTGIQVIQLFLHPPLGTLRREHIAGMPAEGTQHFQRPRPQADVDAMGIRWLILSRPPGLGFTPGPVGGSYDRVMMRVAIEHLLQDGEIVVSQEESWNTATGQILFTESFPFMVHCQPLPGVLVDYWWLVSLTTVPRSLSGRTEAFADASNNGHRVDSSIVGRDGESGHGATP